MREMTAERVIIESLFRIANKDREDVDFILNDAQAQIDLRLSGRDIIPKARQRGVSSYFLARYLAICLSRKNVMAVVISHETDATQRMLAKVHYMLKNIKGPKAITKNMSKNEITFPKTGSAFYIGTAGARQFGRGDTISHLHCSEVAFWPDPKKLTAGLFQAVPVSGEIAMESTGNGVGNFYHRTCMRASENKSRYRMHFLPWHTEEEYTLDVTPEIAKAIMENLNPEWEEDQIVEDYGLDAGRIAWRRMKLEELDFDLRIFKQEYPMTLDECFQSTGGSIFQNVRFVDKGHEWRQTETNLHELVGHPRKGAIYALGADVSGGVGKDRSVIEVIETQQMEQVAEWSSDSIAPDVFAEKVAYVGMRYNGALAAVESNNHGILTIKELLGMYPTGKVVRGERTDTILDYGLRTTAQTKPLMIGNLRKVLVALLTIHSSVLRSELQTFIEHENGSMSAEEGCFDDKVMAIALAAYISAKAIMMGTIHDMPAGIPEIDPFTMKAIISELNRQRGSLPISNMTGTLQ